MIFRLFNYLPTYGEQAQHLATSGGQAQGLGICGPIWPGSFHLAGSGADKFADGCKDSLWSWGLAPCTTTIY